MLGNQVLRRNVSAIGGGMRIGRNGQGIALAGGNFYRGIDTIVGGAAANGQMGYPEFGRFAYQLPATDGYPS